jgi:hypothetical protein
MITGALITSYFVKLRNNEYKPGPMNRPRKPINQGVRKR